MVILLLNMEQHISNQQHRIDSESRLYVLKSAVLYACKNGQLDNVKLLYSICHPIVFNRRFIHHACGIFKWELHILKWLLHIHPTRFDDDLCASAFVSACLNGRLESAKFLLCINPTIDVLRINRAFINASHNGNLEVAKWLFPMVSPSKMYWTDFNYAFRAACGYGHLEFAKWLLSVKPDIDVFACDHLAFINACRLGKIQVTKWLQSLYPHKYAYQHLFLEIVPIILSP